jgi:hypothetical protein
MVEDVDRRPNTPDTSFSTVAQIWGDRVLPITSFNMQAEGRIPDDAAVVILAGPQADLFDAERELLVDFLDEGGSLLVMLDPMMVASRGEMPNLMEILRRVGLGSPNDIIIDPFSGGRGLVFAAFLNNHPIMSGTGSLRLSLRAARPVALRPEEGQRGAMPKPLFLTNEKSWHRDVQRWIVDGQPLQPSDDDPVGSIVLAAASEYPTPGGVRGERARVVLVGDSDFLANDVVDNERAGLGLSMMNWLASRDDQLAIPPRLLPPSSFTLTQGGFWLLVGTLLLVGLGLLLGGTSYAVARRRMR